jgi:hypothetical protein
VPYGASLARLAGSRGCLQVRSKTSGFPSPPPFIVLLSCAARGGWPHVMRVEPPGRRRAQEVHGLSDRP